MASSIVELNRLGYTPDIIVSLAKQKIAVNKLNAVVNYSARIVSYEFLPEDIIKIVTSKGRGAYKLEILYHHIDALSQLQVPKEKIIDILVRSYQWEVTLKHLIIPQPLTDNNLKNKMESLAPSTVLKTSRDNVYVATFGGPMPASYPMHLDYLINQQKFTYSQLQPLFGHPDCYTLVEALYRYSPDLLSVGFTHEILVNIVNTLSGEVIVQNLANALPIMRTLGFSPNIMINLVREGRIQRYQSMVDAPNLSLRFTENNEASVNRRIISTNYPSFGFLKPSSAKVRDEEYLEAPKI